MSLAEKRLNATELEQFNKVHSEEVFKYNNGMYHVNGREYFRTGIAAYYHNVCDEWVPHEVCYGNMIYGFHTRRYKYVSFKIFTLKEFIHRWGEKFSTLKETEECHALYLKMFDMLLDESCFKDMKDNIQFHTLDGERVAYTYFFDDEVYFDAKKTDEERIHPELRELGVFAICARNMLEYPKTIRTMNKFVKMGVPLILAYFFANQLVSIDSDYMKSGGWSQHAFNHRSDIGVLLGKLKSNHKSGITSFWETGECTVPRDVDSRRKFGQNDSIYWTEETVLNLIKNTTVENGLVKWW